VAPEAVSKPAPRRLDAGEVATLLKRGAELIANGNIVAARLMYRHAAEAGEPQAAFALAETYDPLVLQRLGVKGPASDVAMARSWYEKAGAMGSTEAPGRLEMLARRN
jgi:TPR repeat protein